jgi:hypothetical protein
MNTAARHITLRTTSARHRAVVSVMAMMFLVIFASLAAAMAIVSQGNLRTAESYRRVNRALATAETGIDWFNFRLTAIGQNITTTKGDIDAALASQIWDIMRQQIIDDMASELHTTTSISLSGQRVTLGWIALEPGTGGPTFQISIEPHPLPGENYNAPMYQRAPYNLADGSNPFTDDGQPVSADNPITNRYLRIRSTGDDGSYRRSIQMDYRIDKKVRYAILSRNRVMIGRNVIIDGPIGSRFTGVDNQHGHPVQVRDNFTGLDPTLDTWLQTLVDYLAANDQNGDNRIALADEAESAALNNAASYDRNADGQVDAYDMFLLRYDTDNNGSLSTAEFTNTGGDLVDAQLWQLINEVKYPAGTSFDWANLRVKYPGSADWTDAAADLSVISNLDDYAKLGGRVVMSASRDAWEAGAADGAYQPYLRDAIKAGLYEPPMTFDATDADLPDLPPDTFDVSAYRDLATGNFEAQVSQSLATGGSYTAPSAATRETVPYNSPHPYDHYDRPVYQNMTFTNVKIPKGSNALFVNCKFVGVTFVDTTPDNGDPNYNFAGQQEADGLYKYLNVSAAVDGNVVTDTKPLSNNIRFHDCTFEGMVAAEAPQSFAHVRNKLSFTGNTRFDLDAPSLTAAQKAMFVKSTLFAPQYSVDIGTFTQPTSAAEVTQLDGTIVAGVLDIRGQAVIDGTLISTYEPVVGDGPLTYGGNPASFNTTIGYFESSAGDGEGEIPTGGHGKIIVRYDPYRPLPDGISGPIEFRPDLDTYLEGH